MRELARLYEETRARVVDVVAGHDATAAEIDVPACPGWSVKDVVAHLTGNCADVLTGNIVGVATAQWTAAQVEHRRDWKLGDVLAEWDDVGPKFASMLDDFPGQYGRQSLGDLVIHEQDLRGALDRPGARTGPAFDVAVDFATRYMAGIGARVHGLGPLEVRAGDKGWILGTGEQTEGDNESWREAVGSDTPLSETTTAPVAIVTTDPFEWFRAVTGRRSAAQIRRFDWSVDPNPYLALFGYGPFETREEDLEE